MLGTRKPLQEAIGCHCFMRYLGGGTTRGQDKAQVPQNAWGRHGVHVVEVSVVEVTR